MTGVGFAIEQARARIAAAAGSAGRDPDDVTLVAVTKTVPADKIREALSAGVRDLGENRAQDLLVKQQDLQGESARWHFIGTLQRNKVAAVVGRVSMIHSVDSLALAEAIARRAESIGEQASVLLQVNTTGEPTKHGIDLEGAPAIADAIRGRSGLALEGLMTIGPVTGSESDVRRSFSSLRELAQSIGLRHLSMGMSGDFETAIAEGATIVRLGTALFGARPAADATAERRQGTNG